MSFQFEYEKRPPSSNSCDSRATSTTDWSRTFPSLSEHGRTFPSLSEQPRTFPSTQEHTRAYPIDGDGKKSYESDEKKVYQIEQRGYDIEKREYQGHRGYSSGYEGYRSRPLPPRPVCDQVPTKSSVPLKVWVIASASCFAVCAALVLGTVVLARWGTSQTFAHQLLHEQDDLIYESPHAYFITPKPHLGNAETDLDNNNELENDIDTTVLEKLSIFKNVVASREKTKKTEDLISKPQIHPLHDTTVEHLERKIEKKDQAKLPSHVDIAVIATNEVRRPISDINEVNTPANDFKALNRQQNELKDVNRPLNELNDVKRPIPDFKPTLPDVFLHRHGEIKLPDGYMVGLRKQDADYEEFYNDDNFYDDYMQSNTMTSYLIEKVQELHDWINSDPDFETVRNSTKISRGAEFSSVLKALNESIVQGNVSIIMSKLKDLYFSDNNYTTVDHSKKLIVSNSTDLLSFGILTLDIMLLHNIQLMAWENQEAARVKMLKDPNVFAFNALFMDPGKVEAKQVELMQHHDTPAIHSKRQQSLRQDMDTFDIGKSLLENFLEIGMSTARAAINLGRAYKNTKAVLNQLSNRNTTSTTANIQAQMSRNVADNAVALAHLSSSFEAAGGADTTHSSGNAGGAVYTPLDCVWLLYCRNLVATGKLGQPYGAMARVNGMALRMLVGDMPTDKALESMVYEAFSGWTELKCDELFPRCSGVDAAGVVMETILQPVRKAPPGRV